MWETKVLDPTSPRGRQRGPDHRQRQGHHGPPVPARRRPRLLRHHGARREDRQGAVAHAHDSAKPGEPGDETWGDVPMEQRWHVGTWMVPSYDPELEPDLRRHVGDDPGAEVHARRQRQAAPLSQLARSRSTPTPARSSGTTSTSSITGISIIRSSGCSSTRRSRRIRATVTWINPSVKPGETRKVITGIPGKTGIVYTLDRRPANSCGRGRPCTQNVDRRRSTARRARSPVNPEVVLHDAQRPDAARLPGTQRRQELAGRRLQPAHERDVHAAAEHLHERDDARRTRATRRRRLRLQHRSSELAPGAKNVGIVWAISAETGKTTWKHEQRAGMMSLVATGGGLVFGGDVERHASGRSTTTPARCSGRSTSARRSAAIPITLLGRRQAVRRGDDGPVARRRDVASDHAGARCRLRRRACRRVRLTVATTHADGLGRERGDAAGSSSRRRSRFRRTGGRRPPYCRGPRSGGRRARRDGRPPLPKIDAAGAGDRRAGECRGPTRSAARALARRAAEGLRRSLLRRHDRVRVVGRDDDRRHHRDRSAIRLLGRGRSRRRLTQARLRSRRHPLRADQPRSPRPRGRREAAAATLRRAAADERRRLGPRRARQPALEARPRSRDHRRREAHARQHDAHPVLHARPHQRHRVHVDSADRRRQKHVAMLWGGTLFNFAPDAARFKAYADSAARMRELAASAGADVLLSNHTDYDGSKIKLPALAKRAPGAPNPYVVGADSVRRYSRSRTNARRRRSRPCRDDCCSTSSIPTEAERHEKQKLRRDARVAARRARGRVGRRAAEVRRAAATAACDRGCLNALVDSYLAALVAHDPSKVRIAANARFVENVTAP